MRDFIRFVCRHPVGFLGLILMVSILIFRVIHL